MLFLWIFGDNLEHVMGHKRYFIFYLVCGVIASLAHVFCASFLNNSTLVPSLGASGAISGVLGGYILLFPGRSVRVWILITIISLPAFLVLGIWFVFQLVNGMGTLGGNVDWVLFRADRVLRNRQRELHHGAVSHFVCTRLLVHRAHVTAAGPL